VADFRGWDPLSFRLFNNGTYNNGGGHGGGYAGFIGHK